AWDLKLVVVRFLGPFPADKLSRFFLAGGFIDLLDPACHDVLNPNIRSAIESACTRLMLDACSFVNDVIGKLSLGLHSQPPNCSLMSGVSCLTKWVRRLP